MMHICANINYFAYIFSIFMIFATSRIIGKIFSRQTACLSYFDARK